MVTKHLIIVSILIIGLLFFTSCSKEFLKKETALDRNWGTSFESAKQSQILNPEAGRKPEPVVGMDGQAAEKIMEKVIESIEKDEKQEVYNINVGVGQGK